MRPIVTDRVAWSVRRSVCRSVTLVSPAKTAEPIEMQFGLRTRVGPRNHVLAGGPDPPMGRGKFLGRMGVLLLPVRVAWSVRRSVTLVSPAKTAEPIEMQFGLRTRVGPGNIVLAGGRNPPMGRANFGGEWASHFKV